MFPLVKDLGETVAIAVRGEWLPFKNPRSLPGSCLAPRQINSPRVSWSGSDKRGVRSRYDRTRRTRRNEEDEEEAEEEDGNGIETKSVTVRSGYGAG